MAWQMTTDVEQFVEVAGDFLRSEPVRHTTFLTVVDGLRQHGPQAYGVDDPFFGWWSTSTGEVGGGEEEPRVEQFVDDRLSFGGVTLWENGSPVAMAVRTRTQAGMARVQYVYTPPEHRRRGFGGAATTAATQAALDEARPTSCSSPTWTTRPATPSTSGWATGRSKTERW